MSLKDTEEATHNTFSLHLLEAELELSFTSDILISHREPFRER